MSKHRQAAAVDSNQAEIVKALRDIPGVSVQTGVDDIFVGHKGRNFWYELKSPDAISKKTGQVKVSKIEISQLYLLANWAGHYKIVWTLDQILKDMGITKG